MLKCVLILEKSNPRLHFFKVLLKMTLNTVFYIVLEFNFTRFKVTANLFGLEFCKILKSYHKIAHYIYFVLKKKLFENVFFLRSYCKFCVLRD